ncbi:MAG: hypothetical protein WCF18_24610 [Chthoniobacteraceae bacterium]
MRWMFGAIVVVAVAYLGWVVYREATSTSVAPLVETIAPPAPTPFTASARPAPPISAQTRARFAPPGVFYVRERISMETTTGVKALNPGDEVKLMYRYKNGTMRITDGQYEFVVKSSALTQDREQAPTRR